MEITYSREKLPMEITYTDLYFNKITFMKQSRLGKISIRCLGSEFKCSQGSNSHCTTQIAGTVADLNGN